jgi:hypothetical protein
MINYKQNLRPSGNVYNGCAGSAKSPPEAGCVESRITEITGFLLTSYQIKYNIKPYPGPVHPPGLIIKD